MKKVLIIIITFLLSYSILMAASRKVVIDTLKISSNYLVMDCSAEGIIDDKIVEGLRKGRTLTLEYKIQLWNRKSGLFGHLVIEKLLRIKVHYDFWENKFLLLMPDEKRMTNSIETVRDKCTEIKNYQIIAKDELNPDDNYSIAVEVFLRPLSVENYQEIKSWLSGEVKSIDLKKLGNPEKQEKGFKGRFLRIFMAITGFGDRVITGKTDKFTIKENQIVWQ